MIQKIISFIGQQKKDIHTKGDKALFVKLYHLLFMLLFIIPLSLVILSIRLLQPFFLIRFGYFNASRIGSMVAYTAQYLAEDRYPYKGKRRYDIFYYQYPICSYQMLKMWRKVICIPRFPFLIRMLARLNRLFPGYEKHHIPISEYDVRDFYGCKYYDKIGMPVSFTPQEEILGKFLLNDMVLKNKE